MPPRIDRAFLFALLLALPTASRAQNVPGVQITFLDVGQADAILVRAPEGQTALIDAGERAPLEELREIGIGQIDLLVATHPHADHIGGMVRVLDAVPVRYFMDNGQPHTTATYLTLMRTIERRTDIVYLGAEPRTIDLGSVTIEVLPLPRPDPDNLNNGSIGLVVRLGSFRAFLSGDSEREELSWFLDRGAVPDVTLLKAAHHGSHNGFTADFLEAARPEVVVISAGARNSYGHPHAEALAAYDRVAQVYRTDRDGRVTILGYQDGAFEVFAGSSLIAAGRERGDRVEPVPPRPRASAPSTTASDLDLWVFADAPGNDHENENGEYAVLESRAARAADIGGWRLCDAASACFTFPVGAVLPAGGRVVVYTGSGISDGRSFFLGYGRAVWNNDGDVATLFDAAGSPIVRHAYE